MKIFINLFFTTPITVGVIALFSSCQHKKYQKKIFSIPQAVKKICIESDGRGRVKFRKKSYSFYFESILKKRQQKWIFSLRFPLQKPINLTIDLKEKRKVLDNHIIASLKKTSLHEKEVKEVVFFIKKFLWEKLYDKKYFHWFIKDNVLEAISKKEGKIVFKKIKKEGFFSQMSFILWSQQIRLDLSLKKCHASG